MQFEFNDSEIKGKVTEILAYGDLDLIAKRTGKSLTIYSNMYNVNDERESNLHKAAQEIAALFDIDEERGCELLTLFVSLVSRHKKGEASCAVTEVKELLTEHKEFIDARLENKPYNTQLKELGDIRRQLDACEKAIIEERNAKHFGEIG